MTAAPLFRLSRGLWPNLETETVSKDAFASPRQRLGRGKFQLRTLVKQGEAYAKRAPYTRVVEPDPNGVDQLHKLKLTRQLPTKMTSLAIEAIENLRSALDQTGYVTAVLSGVTNPKGAYFPIADSAAQLETDVIGRGRCKDLPSDILTLFRSFKPYKGGNEPIWALNRLCNHSKHRILSASIFCDHFLAVGPGFISGGYIPMTAWDHEKNEMIFGVVGPGGDFKYDFEFSVYVAFGEVSELVGVPAFPMLDAAICEVERILLATESETRRIGLIS
jgi:hypothetical protein